jgi:multiple sugar transport system permease protein
MVVDRSRRVNWRVISGKLAVFAVVLLMIWPFLYIFISSFKPLAEIMSRARVFPQSPTLRNYETLLLAATPLRNFPKMILNSLIVASSTAVATIVVSSMASYAIARDRVLSSGALPKTLLFIYVFPTIILVVPIYQMLVSVGLWDSLVSLIIVYTALASPFCTWLLVSFFQSVPRQLEESAEIDGAGSLTIFFRIVLPLAVPGVVTVGMYSFITAWGEYLFALVLINSSARKTAALGLASFTAEQYIEWGPLLAGSILIMVPVFILFLPIARIFIRGFMAGALKA